VQERNWEANRPALTTGGGFAGVDGVDAEAAHGAPHLTSAPGDVTGAEPAGVGAHPLAITGLSVAICLFIGGIETRAWGTNARRQVKPFSGQLKLIFNPAGRQIAPGAAR
jgi:hypothetical protein